MKRWMALILCVLLTFASLGGALAETADASAAAEPVSYTHDGRVTLIDGATTDAAIDGFEAAAAVVDAALPQLGGDERTELAPWRDVTDAFGNRYYVFQQMCDHTTVLGGAVKVIADASGKMIGLTSSIVSDLPEAQGGEGIAAEEAEQIVIDHMASTRQQTLTVVEGLTDKMILPLDLKLDIDQDEESGSRYVWVVYTANPDCSLERSSDLPYLAHYVALSGEYLYSLPTIMPGDEAATAGFDASYVFEFMEPVNYTGYVDLADGSEMEISIDVMRDSRTGMYYLGNLERRIVVADCWEFLYNDNRVVLEASMDNREWDQVGLLSLYNYCRAYDYYKEIGWVGGDGLGTPILVLNNYCDMNHTPVDNAAYVGGYLGWQLFLASQANNFAQCLDVLGHEFTHCVTGSVMTYNAYKNDYGAINEAMSDIQGKTLQMMEEGAENVTWGVADIGGSPIRSIDDPHRGGQPEFTWDIYYIPNVKTPTVLNDQGGVHVNSSLLNAVAYRLYEKGGMTLEEGRGFWFTVDCAMVPGTDYPQLAELLPWALKASGLEKYETELQRALDATRLGVADIPTEFDADRALLTLNLPENEIFEDGQWVLQLYTVNVDLLVERATEIIGQVMSGDFSELPDFVQALLGGGETAPEEAEAEESESLLGTIFSALLSGSDEGEPEAEAPEAQDDESLNLFDGLDVQLLAWAREHLEGVIYNAVAAAGQDGHTMRIVSMPGYALPILMHGVYNENTSELEEVHTFFYLCDRWIDTAALGDMADEMSEGESTELPEEVTNVVNGLFENLSDIHDYNDVLKLFFYRVEGGANAVLPATGLDAVTELKPMETSGRQDDEDDEAPIAEPRMSRPKEDELPAAA